MDQIRKQLALIDSELAGVGWFLRRVFDRSPLVFPAVGLSAGIVLQHVLFGGRPPQAAELLWPATLLAAALAATAFILIAEAKSTRHTKSPHNKTAGDYTPLHKHTVPLLCLCAAVSSLSLGASRLTFFNRPPPGDIRHLVGQRTPATIRGRLATEPVRYEQRWHFATFATGEPTAGFYLELTGLESAGELVPTSGTIRVYIPATAAEVLRAGDHIRAHCWLNRIKPASNPGQFDTAHYMALRGVFCSASVNSAEAVERLDNGPPSLLAGAGRKIRQAAAGALQRDISARGANPGLLQALLLGQRSDIDPEIRRAFRKTGLSHFISLSGLHIGILVAMIWWLCKTVGLDKPARAAVCAAAVCLFLVVVPLRAPTLRAAIICWVFCASFFFRRSPNALNSLALAAIILLLIRPTHLFEAGWQLSFASVGGILLFFGRIDPFFRMLIAPVAGKNIRRFPARLASGTLDLFCVGVSAWLGGAGILLYHFGTINPLAAVWTVLVFPLVAAILITGFAKIVLAILPPAAALLGSALNWLSSALIHMVKFIADFAPCEIIIGGVHFGVVLVLYATMIFIAFARFRNPVYKRMLSISAAAALVLLSASIKYARIRPRNLIVHCLDVGHGQAVVVRPPGGGLYLLDTGSISKSDVGGRVVDAFLRRSGIGRVDSLIISHGDLDHINGIPEVVDSHPVAGVFTPAVLLAANERPAAVKNLEALLLERGLQIQPLENGARRHKDCTVEIVWPPLEPAATAGMGENDRSAVLLIEFAGRRILLCSDIEKPAQKRLLQLLGGLKLDVVVAPHHGSIKTLAGGFLKDLGASRVLTSCSSKQYRLKRVLGEVEGAEVFHTATDGAITVTITPRGELSCRGYLR